MSIVIITANFKNNDLGFISAVEALLKGLGLAVNKHYSADTTIIVSNSIESEIHNEPVETLPDTSASVPDISNILPDVPVELPINTEKSILNVVLKNLIPDYCISYTIDKSLPFSELRVHNLKLNDDNVEFAYGSSFFKYPIDKPESRSQSNIVNVNPQYTDTSIRVIVEIVGTPITYVPMIIKLVESQDANNHVVFGKDIATLLTHTMEKNKDDSLSTQ